MKTKQMFFVSLLLATSAFAETLFKVSSAPEGATIHCNAGIDGLAPFMKIIKNGHYNCTLTKSSFKTVKFAFGVKDDEKISLVTILRYGSGELGQEAISITRSPQPKTMTKKPPTEPMDYSSEAEQYLAASPTKADCLVKKLVQLKGSDSDGQAAVTASELADFKQSCQ
jgi:hypothetical protein